MRGELDFAEADSLLPHEAAALGRLSLGRLVAGPRPASCTRAFMI